MAAKQTPAKEIEETLQRSEPSSLKIAKKGIRTGADFANLMAALMTDVIDGSISPAIGNAACNAGGKLLKVVEMQYRYGKPKADSQEKELLLAPNITV